MIPVIMRKLNPVWISLNNLKVALPSINLCDHVRDRIPFRSTALSYSTDFFNFAHIVKKAIDSLAFIHKFDDTKSVRAIYSK